MDPIGQIIGGETSKIFIREKSGSKIELGDLLVAEEDDNSYSILQVKDLVYHSQIPQIMRELASGLQLEGHGSHMEFLDEKLRNYIIAEAKTILQIQDDEPQLPKTLPGFFNRIRRIKDDDLNFLMKEKIENPLYLGNVRSGSKELKTKIHVDAKEAIPHHILIPATTGRGKSNLVKVMLWEIMNIENIGMLVLDPHDEYYGRNETGLKNHPNQEKLRYYTPETSKVEGMAYSLNINLKSIRPEHFDGIVEFTSAQKDAIKLYHNKFEENWIQKIIIEENENQEGTKEKVSPSTISVLQRKFDNILGIYKEEDRLESRGGVFTTDAGDSTIKDIIKSLENGEIVIIDTSRLMGEAELLVGSIIVGALFNKYQKYKAEGKLEEKPIIGIVIEEAPRVLGKEVIERQGHNIYSTIAREGRKFNIGLVAITQLVTLIPRTILANMNTKIILGNEMSQERAEIIASASQDLSDDNRAIASLDRGEAIVTSIFTKFAVPVKIPLFEEHVKDKISETKKKPPLLSPEDL
ncbi:MAG TPA: ATP-binding protein [Methanothermobacter sp.]|nr:predicted ATPase [Methanothermobacter sp. MT-2]HHW04700.1 ATP-binding protein [Methanothermobacter sp.]HOK72822.1 ATP-binding protein [Methanothermobacter sp.]HOL69093.1 ATP-binding protein [Methanothermobacter sp.]HPQ04771.1 ATP-binding protein [Methanothermobacter sp.]